MTRPGKSATDQTALVQMRIAHLTMIQGIIGRLAGYSATVKNFAITLGAGVLALAFQGDHRGLPWWSAIFLIFFMILDAYYLALEKSVRTTYSQAATRDLSLAEDVEIIPKKVGPLQVFGAFGSISVWMFHVPLVVFVGSMTYMATHVLADPSPEEQRPSIASVRYDQSPGKSPAAQLRQPAGERVGSAAGQTERVGSAGRTGAP